MSGIGSFGGRVRIAVATGATILALALLPGSASVAGALSLQGGYGSQSNLPFGGLHAPQGIAVDGAGNVYLADTGTPQIRALFKGQSGYQPEAALPFGPLSHPTSIAVDLSGNVYITDAGTKDHVLELPNTPVGYGTFTTLPFTGLSSPNGVAVDTAGDVFVADGGSDNKVFELPNSGGGYGSPVQLPFGGLGNPMGVAVDNHGSVFVADAARGHVLFLQHRTAVGPGVQTTAYYPQVDLPFGGSNFAPDGVAVDSHGNVYVADAGTNENRALFLPAVGGLLGV